MKNLLKKMLRVFAVLEATQSVRVELRALIDLVRHGIPDIILMFSGGIGDELLLTTVAREKKLRTVDLSIWQVSQAAELLRHNPDYARVFTLQHWPLRRARILQKRRLYLAYAVEIIPCDWETPPEEHILAVLCRKAGIKGEVAIKPNYFVTEEEKEAGRLAGRQIALQCVGKGSYYTVMENKLWDKKKFQFVINELKKGILGDSIPEIIQLGNEKDPLLEGVIDLRGKTGLRETAAVLSNCECFIGTSGFLTHLARAVDCRSVIIYGGREHSHQSGYICNENLNSFIECAPCWRWNDCPNGRVCMEMITPANVLQGIKRILDKEGLPLETEVVCIT